MNHLGNKNTSPIAKDWYSFLCACKVVEDSGKVGKPKGCFTGTSVQRQLVIENIFIGAKARKDYELVVHWMVDNGQLVLYVLTCRV